jgi:transcriptional regulator with XRE-family HTH domain
MARAEEIGLHFTYVSSVEREERNIGLQNIVRLAQGLGVDSGTLVKGLSTG